MARSESLRARRRTSASPATAAWRRPAIPVSVLVRSGWALLGLALVILALQVTQEAASSLGSLLASIQASGAFNSLGFGWLFSYVLLSGSPVAAASASLLAGGAFSDVEAFSAIAGSRLGASFFVVLVGFLAYVRGTRGSEGLSVGVVAFLTTLFTQVPALLLGLLILQLGWLDGVQFATPERLLTGIDTLTAPAVDTLDALLHPGLLFAAGLGILLGGFACFDRALPESSAAPDPSGVRADRPMAMFALGAAVTLVTLSVAVSVTLLVPLALRGYIRREQVVPYVMGANITTFIDTLVIAVLLGGQAAFTVVTVQVLAMTIVSAVVLATSYRQFASTVLSLATSATHSRQRFALFLGIIGVVPLLLLFV